MVVQDKKLAPYLGSLVVIVTLFKMTTAQHIQTVRNPPPRMLTQSETLHSLQHWRTNFRTYYRRDTYYKAFLLPNARWDPNLPNYGQSRDENDGVVTRSAEDKAGDLEDFLNKLVGYLPFPYLTEKISRLNRRGETFLGSY